MLKWPIMYIDKVGKVLITLRMCVPKVLEVCLDKILQNDGIYEMFFFSPLDLLDIHVYIYDIVVLDS